MSAFSRVPSTAKTIPTPFKVSIPEEQLAELKTLVKLAKLGPRTHENSQPDFHYGVTWDWMKELKEQWVNDFDWREHENHINEFPQFTTTVEDLSIHFLALFSEKEDAVPVVLLHGWPGSFQEFLPILKLFKEQFSPSDLPYHLIVPSIPGYAFSSTTPLDKTWNAEDIGRVVDKLMNDLGFGGGYVAQGGDIGSRVGRVLAVDYESCKAVHLNFNFMKRPANAADENLTVFEKRGLERGAEFVASGTAYALEHGTRPSTIGHVLASNPLAVLAWCGEKYLAWSDEPLSSKTILEFVSLYWLTETFPRAIYPYRENVVRRNNPASNEERWYISKPFGFSYFPKEVAPIPKSWIQSTGNLVFWREHQEGGHFAALEKPEVLKADLTAFVQQVWK